MATPLRIQRLQARIRERASAVIIHELNDPRMGFVTITKVKLTRDLSFATLFYSVLGDEKERNRCAAALEHARGFVQREVGKVLTTRITPVINFEYDQSVEGSIRVSRLLDEIKKDLPEEEEEGNQEDEPQEEEEQPETS